MPALPLPNGKTQFETITGAPLVGGKVWHYIPGGLVPRDTWQDYDQTILNDNPLTLDARGQAIIWGSGRYRQIVKDSLGNEIWDRETAVVSTRPQPVGFYWPDATAANDIICCWPFTQAVVFPTDFEGAVGLIVGDLPSADTDFDIKNSATTTIGAINVTTTGEYTFSSSISDPRFEIGEALTVHVRAGGANGASGISATFLGELAE